MSIRDVVHICWEFVDATGAGGFHGSLLDLKNTSFVLVNFYGFFSLAFVIFACGP